MIYYDSNIKLLQVNDEIHFLLLDNEGFPFTKIYKIIETWGEGYKTHPIHNTYFNNCSIFLYLKIINKKSFANKFNCTIDGNLTSNNLEDLTSAVKELFLIHSTIYE